MPPNGPFPFLSSAENLAFASLSGDDPSVGSCFSDVQVSLLYPFQPELTGDYSISTCSDVTATTAAVVLAIFRPQNRRESCETCLPLACDRGECGLQARVNSVALYAGVFYYIVFYAQGANVLVTNNNVLVRISQMSYIPPCETMTVLSTSSSFVAVNEPLTLSGAVTCARGGVPSGSVDF